MRWFAPVVALGVALAVGQGAGWPHEQASMAGILTLAAILWITEAVPLFVTSLIVIGAEVILLANPAGWPLFEFSTGTAPSFAAILGAAASPTLVLFFAGLVMARAAVKESVDQAMASWLLRPFAGSRTRLLFGVMGVTALFSMWMSNTASTAFMLTLLLPLLAQIPPADPYRKALLLAVPFAANIGGLGTPIASPPNAIALGYLRRADVAIGFLPWMSVAVPLVLILLVTLGWLLLRVYRSPAGAETRFELPRPRLERKARWVVGIFTATVVLWLTEDLHGLPASAVSLLPLVSLLAAGILQKEDINGIGWDVLILIAGGLALGFGLTVTGLDERIVAALPSGERVSTLLLVLVGITFLFSTVLSNTAVANLVLPIGFAAVSTGQLPAVLIGIALTASLAMALPVSTPPNAMAYARGEFSSADMARVGVPIGLLGVGIIAIVSLVILN